MAIFFWPNSGKFPVARLQKVSFSRIIENFMQPDTGKFPVARRWEVSCRQTLKSTSYFLRMNCCFINLTLFYIVWYLELLALPNRSSSFIMCTSLMFTWTHYITHTPSLCWYLHHLTLHFDCLSIVMFISVLELHSSTFQLVYLC